jgi:cell division protein FtsQ
VRAAFIIVVAGVIVVGVAWALLGSSLLVVRQVRVTGNGGVPAAEVRSAAGIPDGTPLARLDESAAARRVEAIPQILSAQVSRSWPDTVVIAVRQRTPALAVAGTGGLLDLVDVDGVVVSQVAARPAGMPLLTAPPARLRGSAAVRAAVLVLRGLPAAIRDRVTAVTAPSASAVTLHLSGRVTVDWGGAVRGPAKAREVTALLRTGARVIDVSSPAVAVTGR